MIIEKENIIKQGVGRVNLIDPSTLPSLEKDCVIIVNRIRLNSKLVEWEIQQYDNTGEIIKVKSAIRQMKEKEKRTRCILMGAEMLVEDVMKIFPNYEKLPKNSFAEVLR